MDAVTALSGSGPAYVFYLAEAMMDAGISLGFDPQTAATLTFETIQGAARLLQKQNDSPEELRKQVTSPGGTTEAAIGVLQKNRVKHIMVEAIRAAAQRSKDLSA
jgi:pyrroline-5-carboxylate reductase